MSLPGTTDVPPALGNFLYLVGAFLLTGIATLAIVGLTGLEGIAAYAVAITAFVAVFVGLLVAYDRYYLLE